MRCRRRQARKHSKELGHEVHPRSDFEYTPSVETNIRATFERVWRELDTRDQSHTSSGEDCNSVWLECNGELID